MSKTTTIIVALVIGLVIGAVGAYFLAPQTEKLGGSGVEEVYNSVAFQDGLFANNFSQGGAILTFTATTTQAARTLTQAELSNYAIIDIAATTSPALTLTLPATSTMTTLLPDAGDWREWFINNNHTGATTTTIAAGTGIDLIAVTANDDVIDQAETSRLTCWRQADLDVTCIVSELLAAD